MKARVVVNKRDNGDERNEVRAWELVEVNPSAPPPTPPPPPAATTGGPWAVDLARVGGDRQPRLRNQNYGG